MRIIIGLGSCGIAAGGLKVKEEFALLMSENPSADVVMSETGCMGMCYKEVMVEVVNNDGSSVLRRSKRRKGPPDFNPTYFRNSVRNFIVQSSTEPNEQDSFFKRKAAYSPCPLRTHEP